MAIALPVPLLPRAPEQEQKVAHPDQEYIDWLIEGLKAPGMNRRGLAKALGVDPSAITRMLAGRRRIRPDEIKKAAGYLGTPAPKMEHPAAAVNPREMVVEPVRSVRYVPVRGQTAGGRWLEYEVGDQEYQVVPMVPTRFAALEQSAYRVLGNSMDKLKILDGDYVICVPYFEARAGLTDGDIVVVERRRAGLYERTCKLLRVTKAQASLVSSSTDPRHDEPVFMSGNPQEEDGTEIEIVGLVVGRYAPITSAL